MSKAFLPDDAAPEPELARPILSREPQPITPSGLRRLKDELARLDADSPDARPRIATLEAILATVELTAPALMDGGAGFGCAVRVRDEGDTERTYTLVGPDEIDAAAGLISPASPIGAALLGRRRGDIV